MFSRLFFSALACRKKKNHDPLFRRWPRNRLLSPLLICVFLKCPRIGSEHCFVSSSSPQSNLAASSSRKILYQFGKLAGPSVPLALSRLFEQVQRSPRRRCPNPPKRLLAEYNNLPLGQGETMNPIKAIRARTIAGYQEQPVRCALVNS